MEKSQTAESTIGEMVARDYRTAEVFKKYGIDYCCGGGKKLSDICTKKGYSYPELLSELEEKMKTPATAEFRYDEWKASFLIDFIEEQHHTYVRSSLPFLLELSEKVSRVHGDRHPELIEVNSLVHDIAEELSMHLVKEEKILFPFIKQMEQGIQAGLSMVRPAFGTVNNPVRMMETEHEHAGDAMKRIAEITQHYTFPEDACNSYRVFYSKLNEFESDLHKHIHLENNILFPKAVKLEEELSIYKESVN